jgi:hypothetical protein
MYLPHTYTKLKSQTIYMHNTNMYSMHLDYIGSHEMHTTGFKHFKIKKQITNDQNIN